MLLLGVVVVLGACRDKAAPSSGPKMASEAQCRAMMERIQKEAPAPDTEDPEVAAMVADFLRQTLEDGIKPCTERMTARQVECALAAGDLRGMARCEPEEDPRPVGQRPSVQDCERLEDRMYGLIDDSVDERKKEIGEYERELDRLEDELGELDPEEPRVARTREALARATESLERIREFPAQLAESAYRECTRSQPIAEVRCQLAAETLDAFIACAR